MSNDFIKWRYEDPIIRNHVQPETFRSSGVGHDRSFQIHGGPDHEWRGITYRRHAGASCERTECQNLRPFRILLQISVPHLGRLLKLPSVFVVLCVYIVEHDRYKYLFEITS